MPKKWLLSFNPFQMSFKQLCNQASVVLSSLTLLSSLLSLSSRQIQSVVRLRLLPNVVKYIGHKEGLVRKTAHNVFLVSLKTFKNMDQVLQLYMSQGLNHPQCHIRQKVTNSLQSLLITEAKQLSYFSQDFKRVIQKLLGLWQLEDETNVKRAVQQCLNTICKSAGIKTTVKSFNKPTLLKFQIYFYKQRDIGNLPAEVCIQDEESQRQFLTRSNTKPVVIQPPKIQTTIKQLAQEPAQVSSGQIKVSLELITHERDWKIRLQTIQKVAQKINKEKNKPQFQFLAKAILPLLVGLISDSNFKVSLLAVRIIETILQHKQSRALAETYLSMFIEKLADNKLSVRQAVFRILKSDYMRQNKGQYIQKLLQTLSRTRNQSLKEQVLTLLSQIFAEEVLQADLISLVLKETIPFLQDPNTKIKIRTLDCITAVASKSQKAFETSRKFLQPRISKLYFEMFMEKCKMFVKAKQIKEEDRKASSSVGVLSRYYSKESSRQKPMANHASQVQLKSQASKRHSQKQRDNKPQELILPKINKGFRKPAGSFLRKKDVLTDTSASQAGLSRKHISSKISDNPQKFKSRLKKSDFADFRSQNNESFHTLSSMAPFQNPENQVRKILGQLKSQDWQRNLQALQVMKRLLKNHSSVFNSSNVKLISHQLCNLAESLRSNLAKNSLMTISLLSNSLRRLMDSQVQMMMGRLLRRSMDANNFICQQVRKALIALSQNCSEQNVLVVLSNYYSSRSQAIKLSIVQIVSVIVTNPRYIPKEGERIIRILNSFLNQGSSEIRIQARQVLADLANRGHQDLLRRFLEQQNYKKLCLLQIKKESVNKPDPNLALKQPNKSVDSLFKSSDIIIQSPVSSKNDLKIKRAAMPNQLNELDQSCAKMLDPISKNRLQGLKQGIQLAVKYKQFVYFHRSFLKFFDSVNKMQADPNSQVQRAASQAMMLLVSQASKQICQSYSNVILNDLVSMLHRDGVDEVFQQFISKSGIPGVGQYLLNSLNFAIPKLKNIILLKIQKHFDKLMQKNGFKKGLLGVLDKFCDEVKPQILAGLKAVILKLQQSLGEEAFRGRRESLRKFLF